MDLLNHLIVASATDPTEGFRTFVITWGQVAGAVAAIGAVVWASFRFAVLRPLDRRIAEATKQIQPGANGGQSLSDVNEKVDRLEEVVSDLDGRLDRMEQRHLEMLDHVMQIAADMPRRRTRKAADEGAAVERP